MPVLLFQTVRSEAKIEWFVLSNANLLDFFTMSVFFMLRDLQFGICPTLYYFRILISITPYPRFLCL